MVVGRIQTLEGSRSRLQTKKQLYIPLSELMSIYETTIGFKADSSSFESIQHLQNKQNNLSIYNDTEVTYTGSIKAISGQNKKHHISMNRILDGEEDSKIEKLSQKQKDILLINQGNLIFT